MRLDGLPSFSVCVNPQLITRAVTVPSLRLRLFTQIRVAGCEGSLWVIKRASVRLVQSTANLWFAPVWVLRNKSHLRCSSWCSWHLAVHLQLYSPSQHGWIVDMWRAGNARYCVRLQKLSIVISIDLYYNITILCCFFRSPMSARTDSLLLSSSFKEIYFRTTHCLPPSELIATPVNGALILDCIYWYICRGVTLFQWCKIVIRHIDLTLTDATKRKYISAQRCGYIC